MAMFVMIASGTYRDIGVFTPMYLIAAPFAGTEEALRSLTAAEGGDQFTWFTGAGLTGAAIHMGWSMMLGAAFAVLVAVARLPRAAAALGGTVLGLAALAIMEVVTIPVTEALFGGGAVFEDLASTIGWGTWSPATSCSASRWAHGPRWQAVGHRGGAKQPPPARRPRTIAPRRPRPCPAGSIGAREQRRPRPPWPRPHPRSPIARRCPRPSSPSTSSAAGPRTHGPTNVWSVGGPRRGGASGPSAPADPDPMRI